ncbi:MAG: RsmB/NOP family class I SAM-dependent RNA methyltransferase [Clostridia bacterium]
MAQNIPEFLKIKLEEQYGEEIAKRIIEGYSKKRKVTLRVNTLKSSLEKIEKEFIKEGIEYERVPWSKEALIINNVREKEIQHLEIYEKGEIYLQSLSSMLPPLILEPEEESDILDMAAAPGGKTTQIASLVNNKASITACEMNKIRAERLKYNIEKQGATCVYVMVTDARKIDNFFSFDKILLDAPCSGSGTLEINNQDLEKIFTQKLIKKSTSSQLALLKKAINILKTGKEMVYSTCSILKEENEEIVSKVLLSVNAEIVPIEFNGMKDLPLLPSSLEGTLCVQPNELYEGFFIAKIRKIK